MAHFWFEIDSEAVGYAIDVGEVRRYLAGIMDGLIVESDGTKRLQVGFGYPRRRQSQFLDVLADGAIGLG